MTAGSGIIHQEMPQPCPRMLGLQLWVNLPQKDKWAPPQYRDITAERIPKVQEASGTVSVISGVYGDARGATAGDYVAVTLLDVALRPGALWRWAAHPADTVFAYLVEGYGQFGAPSSAHLESHRALLLGAGDECRVQAGNEGLRFVIAAGRPLNEPIAWGGPIVMNTQEELDHAFEEIRRGTFIRSG